ncbi:hypothetical protein NHP21005_10840 [Helicobacter sp. NHP21005]|nr:hypothetical protein NHP21005_10840 [Helicobacter sp. NHP21005]
MDFIIPDKINPQIIIECSFLSTTSSAQGDKSYQDQLAQEAYLKWCEAWIGEALRVLQRRGFFLHNIPK